MDFKTSHFMYGLGAIVVIFVVAQSLFFLIKAWKHGKEIGMSTNDLRNSVVSSALFTIAPALAILATVVTLAGSLGLVLPWIRLTVIGNITYEVTAAQGALDSFNIAFGTDITSQEAFAAVAWVMTIGSILPLFLVPVFLKKLQSKIGQVTNKSSDSRLPDILSAATFIGLISAFIGNALAGKATYKELEDGTRISTSIGAGIMSVAVLLTSIIVYILLEKLCTKVKKLEKLEPFVMPISMFVAMGMAILLTHVLPENLVTLEWRPVA